MTRLIDCKTGWRKLEFDDDLLKKCAENGIQVIENDCQWNSSSFANRDYSAVQERAKRYGIYMQSVHLLLGTEFDLSLKDTAKTAVMLYKKQIYNAAKAGIKYGVLHPSAEPIADDERQKRMDLAQQNIATLCDYAAECGLVLCIEDLPRSCLCNDIDELKGVLNVDERLRICFDVNHLLKCSHADFVKNFGDKIVTTHISDYDFIDDRHWLVGDGKIDWNELANLLEQANYCGAFLYECDADRRHNGKKPLGIDTYRKIHENIANRKPPLFSLE